MENLYHNLFIPSCPPAGVGYWFCYPTRLGSACLFAVKSIHWHQAVVCCRTPSKEPRQVVFNRLELCEGFQGKVLKTGWGRVVVGWVTSLWTFFWLVGGEASGSQHQIPSGIYLWALYGYLQPGEGFSIFRTAQRWLFVSLGKIRPCPKVALLFLGFSSLVYIFPFLRSLIIRPAQGQAVQLSLDHNMA